jgi:hypothetical protein
MLSAWHNARKGRRTVERIVAHGWIVVCPDNKGASHEEGKNVPGDPQFSPQLIWLGVLGRLGGPDKHGVSLFFRL